MGLAATREKQRFGLDPRNTAWSNDTSRFGHRQLEKFGWQPGKGLGMSPNSSHTSHIKVSIKDDTVGLGAKIKRTERKDEFDNGECAGLDVFQRILGRLNGKEEEISNEIEKQRKDKILNGRWGIHFVQSSVLASTWDPETKELRTYSNEKKRSRSSEPEDSDSSSDENDSKKHKKEEKIRKKEKKREKKKQKKDKKIRKIRKIGRRRSTRKKRRTSLVTKKLETLKLVKRRLIFQKLCQPDCPYVLNGLDKRELQQWIQRHLMKFSWLQMTRGLKKFQKDITSHILILNIHR